MNRNQHKIKKIYELLLEHFGPRGWWPGETRLEIIVGAILTQAVAWKNVEKAIYALKHADLLDYSSLLGVDEEELAKLIKPALYNRQKAKKIKIMLHFVKDNYDGSIESMLQEPLDTLRAKLLSLWGIGPETADSILLYAADYRVFVIDGYTIRIFARLGMIDEKTSYSEMQDFMHVNVIPDSMIYNEYHALLVALGAGYCRKNKPVCRECPLAEGCKYFSLRQENK